MTEDQDGPKTDDKLSTPAETRIPLAANRIQVNFCKNPKCTNFGVPASNESQPKGRITTSNKKIDTYIVVAGHSGKEHMLRCRLCGEYLESAVTDKPTLSIQTGPPRVACY